MLFGNNTLKENFERHSGYVQSYLNQGIYTFLPEEYKGFYKKIFKKHSKNLGEINKNCKITLVIPAFNEQDSILSCLESLNQQKSVQYGDFEVLLIINYPKGYIKDNTIKIVKGFLKKSNFPLYIIEQIFPEDIEGIGIASKLGIDLAVFHQRKSPRIISRYRSGTVFSEYWISKLIELFNTYECDAIQGNIRYRIKENKKINFKKILEIQDKLSHYERLCRVYYSLLLNQKLLSSIEIVANLTTGIYCKISGLRPLKMNEDFELFKNILEKKGKIIKVYELKNKKINYGNIFATCYGKIKKPNFRNIGWSYLLYNYSKMRNKDDIFVSNPDYIKEKHHLWKELKNFYYNRKKSSFLNQYYNINLLNEIALKSKSFEIFEILSRIKFYNERDEKFRFNYEKINLNDAIKKLKYNIRKSTFKRYWKINNHIKSFILFPLFYLKLNYILKHEYYQSLNDNTLNNLFYPIYLIFDKTIKKFRIN